MEKILKIFVCRYAQINIVWIVNDLLNMPTKKGPFVNGPLKLN